MKFAIEAIKATYKKSSGWERELGKWAFSIFTFGLGGLYLWATTRIIAEGEIGIRETLDGKMLLLPPGRHSNFPWENYPESPRPLSDMTITLGPYKIFTVKTGYVAETYDKGKLVIYEPGQYIISDQAHTIKGAVSTKLATKKLHSVQAYTQDNVGLTLQADVRYRIQDPILAIGRIDEIEKFIIETAEMTIANVVGHHKLCEFAPAISRIEGPKNSGGGIGTLLEELSAAIKKQFHDLGIHLDNIGITSWSILDKSLAHELAQGAVLNSQIQSKMITAGNDAEIRSISTNAEALRITTLAEAEAKAVTIKGNAILTLADKMKKDPIAQQLYHNEQNIKLVSQAKNANLFFNHGPRIEKQPKIVANLPLKDCS